MEFESSIRLPVTNTRFSIYKKRISDVEEYVSDATSVRMFGLSFVVRLCPMTQVVIEGPTSLLVFHNWSHR